MNDNLSRAQRVAREAAREMRRKLDAGSTPADMGWPDLTADQLVRSEYQCWLDEELNEDRKTGRDSLPTAFQPEK